jgi:nitrile hydratase accessory protein
MTEPLQNSPGIPHDAAGPVFREPWEAQAFAMTLCLYERAVFTWQEWASELAEAIRAAQAAGDEDLGDTYYQHWLRALERLIERKSVASTADIERTQSAWRRAAARTPHGKPIELTDEDFG